MEKQENPKIRKLLLYSSLIVNLGILGFFKYFNFFIESFQTISNSFGVQLDYLHLNIILPVGVSFYTFQTLSYSIDVYLKKLKPTRNFIDFALFVSFFPQLVAGPIERAKALLPQLAQKINPTRHQIKQGIVLIVMGLFRKVMIGDTSGRFVDHIFSNPEIYSSWELIIGLILFSIQIYADFSGYSHIARGTAKLLGIEIMKNFEQPYFSRNITEFWRRWHISLSSWLKDYLYIAFLGGNKKGNRRTYLNLLITMLLGGLWHGASWNFVIWGGLHGVYLAVHKLILKDRKIGADRAHLAGLSQWARFLFNVLFTNLLVLFTWLFFRATSWTTTKIFFHKMFNWESSDFSWKFTVVALSFIVVMVIQDAFEYFTGHHTYLLQVKSKPIIIGTLGVLFLVTITFMLQSDPLPFVYFQF